ncbi:hypothetical protein [Anaerosinus gibii]|uniref:Uncharacterized protein n=1 Tax=Selenobaculum gibii TaxID=3054208 RepID=A0A9Y2AHI4_9FIRM|nr:hypothetical protein [Selenobaculum gbiensis]WIW69876.1 hypothetical protein P3F81_08080 [Selenobaculum gbiensis]
MIFSSELENWIFLIVLVISITSFLYLKWILKETEKTNHISYTICKAQNKSSEYFMNYIALYLLPCLGLSLENIVDVIVMVCVMCIIGYIYIQCDLIYMNPVLNMLGYKIFSVVLYDSSGGEIFETIAVVHKSVLLENNFSYKGTMNNGIIFMRKEHKND